MVLSSSGGECKLGVRHIESKWMKLWWLCEKPVGEQEMARAQIEVGGQLVLLQGQDQQEWRAAAADGMSGEAQA